MGTNLIKDAINDAFPKKDKKQEEIKALKEKLAKLEELPVFPPIPEPPIPTIKVNQAKEVEEPPKMQVEVITENQLILRYLELILEKLN